MKTVSMLDKAHRIPQLKIKRRAIKSTNTIERTQIGSVDKGRGAVASNVVDVDAVLE